MAPRKSTTQGKRNSVKIKSKLNKETFKKAKKKRSEEERENFKWMNKKTPNASYDKTMPKWLQSGLFELKVSPPLSSTTITESGQGLQEKSEELYSDSEISEECNCSHPDETQNKILKQKRSSRSVVSNYLKSGMDQVASFIVESAIRFGEQHGVIVQDKKVPNLYEFTPTDERFGEKFRKIRFKIPDKPLGREDEKKHNLKSHKTTDYPEAKDKSDGDCNSVTTRQRKKNDSLEDILPILEKLKEEEDSENFPLEKQKSGNKGFIKEMQRDRVKSRNRMRDKKYQSNERAPSKSSEKNCRIEGSKLKKFRRDSLELGRRRLKAANCFKKQKSASMTPS